MYIYENHDWPHFIFDEGLVQSYEKRAYRLRFFLEGILSVLNDRRAYGADMLGSSLHSSWAIEGISLSDDDIRTSISRRLDFPSTTGKPKGYYDGIAEATLDAVQNHGKLTIERLLSWHRRIVEINPGVKRGAFRNDSVYVVSGSYKNSAIIYEAPSASSVPKMMKAFLSFVNSEMHSDLVMSGIAHLHLVLIHPFEDGNGRMARLIGDHVMARHSEALPGVLASAEIRKKQKEYYEILNRTSKGSLDITEWLTWYLERLIDAYEEAIRTVQRSFAIKAFFERAVECGINERQDKFLRKVLAEDWKEAITAKKYAAITGCHPDTANRDLKKLTACGLLHREGNGKNTHYTVIIE